MKFKWDRASIPRFAILLAVILLGVAIGISLGPGTPSGTLRSSGIYRYIVAPLSVLFLVALGVTLLELGIDREHQLDRDLLRAFLKYIPDNVFFKDRDSRFVRISSAMAKYCNSLSSEKPEKGW